MKRTTSLALGTIAMLAYRLYKVSHEKAEHVAGRSATHSRPRSKRSTRSRSR